MKLPSPVYWAEMVCVPCDKEEMFRFATPALRLTGEPNGDPSAMNCTIPEGIPALGATGDNNAVRVTFEPVGDGLAEEVTELTEDAGVMVNWPATNSKL